MKVLNRTEFLQLPAGAIFAQGIRWSFSGLCLKGDTLCREDGQPIDFRYTDLVNIDMGHDSGEWLDRLENMIERGASFPLNEDEMRDGRFDDQAVFLVYEREDLDRLMSVIGRAYACT